MSKANVYTLDNLNSESLDTAVFVPKHPKTGEDVPSLSITFLSPFNEQYKQSAEKKAVAFLKAVQKNNRKELDHQKTLRDERDREIRLLAEAVVTWGEGYQREGKKLEPTVENAYAVFSDSKFYPFYIQAKVFQSEEANFFLESKES